MSYRYSHYHPICPMQPIQHPEHLFRVIRAYDVVPEDGFECGDQAAGLTFEQLIQKGFNNKVKSQFISTTKSASTAISWTIKVKCAFAIMSCRALNQDIRVYDLSGDCSRILTPWANEISTRHQEVLLTPYINEKAIVGIVQYSSRESRPAMYSSVTAILLQSLVADYMEVLWRIMNRQSDTGSSE
ncbi:hypothetical protein K457DRAFT_21841 [Linnemannia elongata AG-77]|uniref:Uncharacterized protein n=1 Tax=Linnemannia elongata AG-77 TaxID=1314771 RepID=A0A197JR95_9FUNG|nr:hypothetical protein K457DRAFT_21841 [Linnemannia elongata AG-77]